MQAKTSGNMEQGDEHEAVFARLRNGDTKIDRMRSVLGNDLEIISDDDYCLLRRRSSKFMPIYCMYTITVDDFQNQIKHAGKNRVQHDLPQEIYSGFAASFESSKVLSSEFLTATVFFQSEPFFRLLDYSLLTKDYTFTRKAINYDLMSENEFFIEPTDKRDELFAKRSKYRYQHEVRYLITNYKMRDVCERINIYSPVVNPDDKHIFNEPIGMSLDVTAYELPS